MPGRLTRKRRVRARVTLRRIARGQSALGLLEIGRVGERGAAGRDLGRRPALRPVGRRLYQPLRCEIRTDAARPKSALPEDVFAPRWLERGAHRPRGPSTGQRSPRAVDRLQGHRVAQLERLALRSSASDVARFVAEAGNLASVAPAAGLGSDYVGARTATTMPGRATHRAPSEFSSIVQSPRMTEVLNAERCDSSVGPDALP